MHKRLIAILLVIFLALLIPSIVKSLSDSKKSDEKPDNKDFNLVVKPIDKKDISINVYDHRKKEVVKMNLEDYIVGAVAGEMPASFDSEALKAQAVAARTLVIYKLRKNGGRGCEQAANADVCTSFAHCQAFVNDHDMQNNWGGKYKSNLEKIKQAVYATWGEILTYNGDPIEVFYYSTSNGKTEEASEVFSNSLPYYKVVDSTGEENAPRYFAELSMTKEELANKIKQKYPGSSISAANIQNQIWIDSYTDSGRVRTITTGGIKLSGTEFRLLLGLNSADFSLNFYGNSVTIKTKGFGHGVGMSQYGADSMAKGGSPYKDILRHYYQGVSIEHY